MPEGITEGIVRIVIGLVALLIGWAIGFFDSKMRTDKKIKEVETKSKYAIQQARNEVEHATAQAARAAASAPPGLTGTTLLRLWLDSAQQPGLDLDGQAVDTTHISELHRKRLITLLGMLRPWVEGRPAASTTAMQNIPPASPQHTTSSAETPSPVPMPIAEEKPAASLSIVGQIDEILQTRLASTKLTGRSIRLQESSEGGVIVWVGMKKFADVGEVTDPEVQAVIRAAIAEWESKYTPGL